MNSLSSLIALSGSMAWPLIICSFLGLMIIIERLLVLSAYTLGSKDESKQIIVGAFPGLGSLSDLGLHKHPYLTQTALQFAAQQAERTKSLREERFELWLIEKRKRFQANLNWLGLIAMISPLLGLLGTVLGILDSFQNLVDHKGPIHPGLIAEGLHQAMLTTVIGLSIAIPALIALTAFRIWTTDMLEHIETLFNKINLLLEDTTLSGNHNSSQQDATTFLMPGNMS